MIAGPLTDSQIFYKPSKNLVKFIQRLKNFSECDNGHKMPKAVANIAGISTSCTQTSTTEDLTITASEYLTVLNTNDIQYLNQLNLDCTKHLVNLKPCETTVKKLDKLLTFDDLTWLHQFIEMSNESKQEDDFIYFHRLFQGTEIILPKNKEIPRSEELEARCAELRNQQSNREYKLMTKNVDNTMKHMPEDTIAYQMKQINTQLIAVFQFVVSVLTGFLFGFIGIELMTGSLDFGFRLLLGIICALIIALAELYFLAKKLNEEVELGYSPTAITSNHVNSKIKAD